MTGENYLKAAYAYLYIRDFARASNAFKRAIETDPENPSYYFHASVTALRNECFDLAKEWAADAVRLEPDNPLYREHQLVVESSILTRKGHEALLEGHEQEAQFWFEQALAADPLNEEAKQSLLRLSNRSLPGNHAQTDQDSSGEALT